MGAARSTTASERAAHGIVFLIKEGRK